VTPDEREWMPDGVAAAYVGSLVGIPLVAALVAYATGSHIALVAAVLFLPWMLLVAPRALTPSDEGDRAPRVLVGLALVPVLAAGLAYATPVPFASALVPLFLAWALVLVPRAKAQEETGERAKREGVRPVRFRWVATWTVVAIITVPLLLGLLLL